MRRLTVLLVIVVILIVAFSSCKNNNDKTEGDNAGDLSIGENSNNSEHVHTFNEDLLYDSENHYNLCICGEKANIESHTFSEVQVIDPATDTEPGISMVSCLYCSCKIYQTIPIIPHTHVFLDEHQYDSDNHWRQCSCGETNILEQHDFNEWLTVKEPSEDEYGEKERKCKVCLYKQNEYIPKLVHTHSFIGDYQKDGIAHWKNCICGTTSEKEVHSFGEYIIFNPATEEVEGLKKRTCTLCNYVESVTIPVLSHTHKFDTLKFDEISHYNVCSCGEKQNIVSHRYGEYIIDYSSTCVEKGKKTHICTVCKYSETVEIPLSEHIEQVMNSVKPTCVSSGLTEGKYCSYCNLIIVSQQTLAPTGHSETIGDAIAPTCYSVGYSAEKYCGKCGFIVLHSVEIKKLPHTYSDGVCSTCEFPEPSKGLEFALSNDGTYYVVTGVGTCKDDIIVIPEEYQGVSVREIANNAFELCVSIREVVLPDSVTTIGEYAFYGCKLLTNITLGKNISKIGFGMLYDTAYYQNQLNWDNGVLYLNNALIEVKSREITSVSMRDGIFVIADYAFAKSIDLVSVDISKDVKFIGKYAFKWCDALTSITVPEGNWHAVSSRGDTIVSLTNATSVKAFTETYYYCNWYLGR